MDLDGTNGSSRGSFAQNGRGRRTRTFPQTRARSQLRGAGGRGRGRGLGNPFLRNNTEASNTVYARGRGRGRGFRDCRSENTTPQPYSQPNTQFNSNSQQNQNPFLNPPTGPTNPFLDVPNPSNRPRLYSNNSRPGKHTPAHQSEQTRPAFRKRSYSDGDSFLPDWSPDDIELPDAPDITPEKVSLKTEGILQTSVGPLRPAFLGAGALPRSTGHGISTAGQLEPLGHPKLLPFSGLTESPEQYRQPDQSADVLAEGTSPSTAESVLQKYLTEINRQGPFLEKSELQDVFNQANLQLGLPSGRVELGDIKKLVGAGNFVGFVLEAKKRKTSSADGISNIVPLRQPLLLSTAQNNLNTLLPFPSQLSVLPPPKENDNTTPKTVPPDFSLLEENQDINHSSQQVTTRPQKAEQASIMATPNLEACLLEISQLLKSGEGDQMAASLLIEPPFPDFYNTMISELRASYPAGEDADGIDADVGRLGRKCLSGLSETSSSWPHFVTFVKQYFMYIRDVDVSDLLATYFKLTDLVKKSNVALEHPEYGIIILPTVISYSTALTKLAIGLEKRPDLMAQGVQTTSGKIRSSIVHTSSDYLGDTITLPERAANLIRSAIVACFNDQSSTVRAITGKKLGLYKLANLSLKILLQCQNTKVAKLILSNMKEKSPPLALYPSRADRITYLYYVGRIQFSTNYFYQAQLAFQAAFDECLLYGHEKQRRLILVYLVTSNIILGRFPTEAIYTLSEAVGFRERFQPLCRAIAQGDLATFRALTDVQHENADWFIGFHVFQQLRTRCEVLVWRSLVRKGFLLTGDQGDNDAKRAPTLKLEDLTVLFRFLEERAPDSLRGWVHPDLEDMGDDGYEELEDMLPDYSEVENIVSSLIEQGLLNGFIAHRLGKFAVQGARSKPALEAGFPNVWQVISTKSGKDVPGWKT